MASILEDGEIYNCQFKKKIKASKNFIKTYEAATYHLNEINQTIQEAVFGVLKGESSWGLFIATNDQLYYINLKKKITTVKQWNYNELLDLNVTHKSLMGHKINFKTVTEDWNINSITEGDPYSFITYVNDKIAGNLEAFNEKQDQLKSNLKEFYFKTSKTRIIIDDNYVRVDKKGAINAITRGFSGEKSYRIDKLSGVQIKKPGLVTTGYFQFLTAAANETGGLWDAIQDDNSFTFSSTESAMAEELKNCIETEQIRQKDQNQSIHVEKSSVADELMKFKQLLDMNAITLEEYNQKKKELLNLN
ncbi:SHOCT domain-containing protein [Bacillus safensis]|uniref:SHOCT domain-containing protein n=1 Tax=Bacillus safensis TaxID=561879 RepID=UPI0020763BD1|nr:SHOCT domain-containing protein [Bacillus safensis]USD79694.1 SHOCT domain-containing protein [Bacillus safensis]